MNNIEKNKLILIFMNPHRDKRRKKFPFPEDTYVTYPPEKILGYGTAYGAIERVYHGLPEEMLYSSSWNSIMPVIARIEKMGFNTLISDFQVQISFTGEDNMQRNVVNIFIDEVDKKITYVYEAAVEFIQWHNKEENIAHERI